MSSNTPLFSYYRRPIQNLQPQAQWTILDAWHYIIGDDAAETTRQLRTLANPKERQAFKAGHFDYATFSGTFKQRGKDGLIRHSGLICLDFDHLTKPQQLQERLLKDEYFETMLLFRSPGGNGLKWVIPIELGTSTQERFFDALWWYCRKTYGITPDRQCRDVGRACFLPYDPEAYINPALR
ncbi:MAG: virulence protein E [Bacteroidales bacterium]|nr:virulence protein E [Bacteroidales bacterium]